VIVVKQYSGKTVDKSLPADSGIINVNYGAKGDGITDDTLAIQTAITSNSRGYGQRTIYFPNGTYLVSRPLEWRDNQGNWWPFLIFQGQSRTNTIIKLKNYSLDIVTSRPQSCNYHCFGEPFFPRWWWQPGFFNSIHDLTVDTGSSNPGAIGIDYMANNKGAIRDVTIRGQGSVGLCQERGQDRV